MNIIRTIAQLNTAVKELSKADTIAYDIESSGLLAQRDVVLIIALASKTYQCAIDVRQIGAQVAYKAIQRILETKLIIAHNASFDVRFAFHYNVLVKRAHCTMLTEKLLSAGLLRPEGFSLKALVNRYKGLPMEKETRSEFIDNPDIKLEDRHFEYALTDTVYLFDIMRDQMRLIGEQGLRATYDLEMSIIPATSVLEYTGIALNEPALRGMIPTFDNLVKQSERALQDLFIQSGSVNHILVTRDGYTAVNLNSKPIKRTNKITGEVTYNLGQVYEAFQALGVTPTDKKGNPSLLAKNVLKWDMQNARGKAYDYRSELNIDDDSEDFADAITAYEGLKHPVLRAYTFYIAATKLRDSYVIGTLNKYNPETKRVYGWFSQLGARSTGRFSSDMQQIPQDGKLKALSVNESIRGCFIAPPGRKLLISDYAGIELVILADYSNDEVLGKLIVDSAEEKDDMHLYVVRSAFGALHSDAHNATLDRKDEPLFKLLRKAAKPTSYGIAYGITQWALADTISKELAPLGVTCTPKQAETILNDWKKKAFAKAGKWLDATSRQAQTQGYVESYLGRKRYFDLDYARQYEWKMHAIGREGCNMPVQGGCASLVKLAFYKMFQRLDIRRARIIWLVHDEFVVEATDAYANTAAQIMKECMESSAQELMGWMGKYVKSKVSISDCYNK